VNQKRVWRYSSGRRPTWYRQRERQTEREKGEKKNDVRQTLFLSDGGIKLKLFTKYVRLSVWDCNIEASWVMVEDKELWKFSISSSATHSLSLSLFISPHTKNWMNNGTVGLVTLKGERECGSGSGGLNQGFCKMLASFVWFGWDLGNDRGN